MAVDLVGLHSIDPVDVVAAAAAAAAAAADETATTAADETATTAAAREIARMLQCMSSHWCSTVAQMRLGMC